MLTLEFILLGLLLTGSSVIFSMYGQGGGVLYAPIQVLFGIEFHEAAAMSQLFIIITSLSSTLVFRKGGKVDWALAWTLESTAVAGGYLGGLVAYRFAAQTMLLALGAVVLAAALSMMMGYKLPVYGERKHSLWPWRRETGGQVYTVELALGLPLSFFIGVVSGMTGVAGGFLKVPMLALLLGVPIEIAFGSSAFMVSLTATGGMLGHLTSGGWDWDTALVLGALVGIGAQIGPRLTLRTEPSVLRRRFSRLLLVVACAVLYMGWSG